MKPFQTLKSSMTWMGAIALGLSLASAPVSAQKQNQNGWLQQKQQNNGPQAGGGNLLPGGNGPDIQPESKLSFYKTAEQLGCKHVRFKIGLKVTGTPGFWDDPDAIHVKLFTQASQKLTDQLPKGLSWVSANLTGDISAPPAFVYQTTSHANDTLKVIGIKFSPDNEDGFGGDDVREWKLTAIAKIDPAEFPVAKIKSNQAKLKVDHAFGTTNGKSHDPALPEPLTWTDGDPTKFLVDLTDCDDPGDGGGDPDDEPCIKLEKGEVECHGGPIAPFTYKMPVGPELEGTTIELTSLTPGVTVVPAFQVVPPGGGILEWDLVGAAKGMTIHLLTNNVKQVGPADFDGLATCCTEEIIIDIPEDIPCDDEDKEPDLKVIKKALVEVCDKEEGNCKFRIRVKNVGDKKFTGPLALDEWQIPEKANIVAGPNPAWNCAIPFGLDYYICKHPALTLNPGEFKDLKLTFKPGPAWIGDKIKNCAKLNYGEMGVAPFGKLNNDKDCAEICIKGSPDCPDDDEEQKEPKLEIRKFVSGPNYCQGNPQNPDACFLVYSIIIHNYGDGDYNGALNVKDSFSVKPDNVTFNPLPPWNCATVDGQNFDCTHPPTNIPANGQMILSVTAKFNNPFEIEPKKVTNCAKLEEGEDGKDEDCVDANLPEGPPPGAGTMDIKINKTCEPGVIGGRVTCRISVTYDGTSPPRGILRVFDVARVLGTDAPLVAEDIRPDGPEWQCEGAPATDLVCAIAGEHFTRGTTRYFEATIPLPVNSNDRYRNCATLHHEAQPGNMVMQGQSCFEGGVDIRVEKKQLLTCNKEQGNCAFTIIMKNESETDYSGNVTFVDALGLDAEGISVPIKGINGEFPCDEQPTSVPFKCEGTLDLKAGQQKAVTINLDFSGQTALGQDAEMRNCASVIDGDIAIINNNAEANIGNEEGFSEAVGCTVFRFASTNKDQCTPPMVMNDNGVCVCPEGSKWNGRRCVGADDTPPVVIPDPLCVPGRGEIRTRDNRCVCRTGYIRKGPDLCVPPSRGCTPGPNEYKNRQDQCVCKRGYTRNNYGICVKIPVGCKPGRNEVKTSKGLCVCKPGYQRNKNGFCIKIPPLCKLGPNEFRNSQGQCVCKSGYERNRYRICVKTETCKPGRNETLNNKGQCVCKPGFKRGKGGYCVAKPTGCTKPNEIKNSVGRCVCKAGYKRDKNGLCSPQITGNCTKPNEVKNSKGQCVCKAGYQRNRYQICVKKPDPRPQCIGGKLYKGEIAWSCVCPRGWERSPLPNNGAKCIKPDPKPVCSNGKLIKRGKGWYCSCPKGWKRNALPNGGARCTRPAPKPVCSNGKLNKRGKGWYCSCPKGWTRNALPNGGARCSRPAPRPDCINGKLIKRGKGWYCSCPKGYNRKPYSNGGALCTKPVAAPKPPCINGRLSKRGKGWFCSCPNGWKRTPIGNKGGASCQKVVIYKPQKPVIKVQPKQPTLKINPKVLKIKPNNQIK